MISALVLESLNAITFLLNVEEMQIGEKYLRRTQSGEVKRSSLCMECKRRRVLAVMVLRHVER
jgi:hypothetical protein